MRSILESLRDKVENGSITIREAALALHKAGWTNFIDIIASNAFLVNRERTH